MRVLLISTNREHSPFPVAPLGALCVNGALKKAGYSVDFLDMNFINFPKRAIAAALKTATYDVIAFSIRNLDNCFYAFPKSFFSEVEKIVNTVRDLCDTPTVVGGSGFSVDPIGWMKRLNFDYGIVGEGEKVFVELLDYLQAGKSPSALNGVITKENLDKNNNFPSLQPIANLDEIAPPSHEFCKYKKYINRGGFVSIQSKRGCPFSCIFCVYPQLEGSEYRLRCPELVVDEIERTIHDTGINLFFFTDSVFNAPRSHCLEICNEIARRRLSLKWMAYCNPLGFDFELAQAMKQSGCAGIEFGLDAATEKMIESLGKPFSQSEIKKSLQAAFDAKIPFAIHLLFGGPGETVDDVKESQNFLDSCAKSNAVFASIGIRIYLGTPIYQTAMKQGVISTNSDLFHPTYYVSEGLTEKPVQAIDVVAHKRNEWTTPTDWNKLPIKAIQTILNRFKIHPQWQNIQNYGKYVRR